MAQRASNKKAQTRLPLVLLWLLLAALFLMAFFYVIQFALETENTQYVRGMVIKHRPPPPPPPVLDKVEYDKRIYALANYPVVGTSTVAASSTDPTGSPQRSSGQAIPVHKPIASSTKPWPVRTAPYPKVGAILPFYRVIAYYGNFYSKGMGVLGQYPEEEMLEKLRGEVAVWEAADPTTPVKPAIHYIVQTAQVLPQKDGSYRLQMPDGQIDKALEIAEEIDGIVFIDFQVGFSTLEKDLPDYERYLAMPNVHVGIDPEFSMKGKYPPGREIGTFYAEDITGRSNICPVW